MNGDRGQVVVVQPGPSQLGFGQVEAERLDQMQFTAGCGARPDGVAGVGGDTRRYEQQPEHPPIMAKRPVPVCRPVR
ncbi:Uncharacterised protein [Mycobacterium tuberculosis]|uniref:Uncharacterized protein n=1 Tax=Mycobacterium tuberculosis TaxID=1773 RepID=A0A916L9R0_MYCTX|nr:Uncharacterised protein [Mycobacterium tuberculosis]